MRKFELFMGRLGNGVTVCNSAVQEHGDYKMIAHIAECGKIKWYIDPQTVPSGDLERIERTAAEERKNWEKHLSSIGESRAYGYLLERVPHSDFMHVVRDMKGAGMAKQIEYLKSAYIKEEVKPHA